MHHSERSFEQPFEQTLSPILVLVRHGGACRHGTLYDIAVGIEFGHVIVHHGTTDTHTVLLPSGVSRACTHVELLGEPAHPNLGPVGAPPTRTY